MTATGGCVTGCGGAVGLVALDVVAQAGQTIAHGIQLLHRRREIALEAFEVVESGVPCHAVIVTHSVIGRRGLCTSGGPWPAGEFVVAEGEATNSTPPGHGPVGRPR